MVSLAGEVAGTASLLIFSYNDLCRCSKGYFLGFVIYVLLCIQDIVINQLFGKLEVPAISEELSYISCTKNYYHIKCYISLSQML